MMAVAHQDGLLRISKKSNTEPFLNGELIWTTRPLGGTPAEVGTTNADRLIV
jgi:hypothetical protein